MNHFNKGAPLKDEAQPGCSGVNNNPQPRASGFKRSSDGLSRDANGRCNKGGQNKYGPQPGCSMVNNNNQQAHCSGAHSRTQTRCGGAHSKLQTGYNGINNNHQTWSFGASGSQAGCSGTHINQQQRPQQQPHSSQSSLESRRQPAVSTQSERERSYAQWEQRMIPILQNLESREEKSEDFYASEILKQIPRHGKIAFSYLVRGKSQQEVSRWFFTAMMMASEGSIEINQHPLDGMELSFKEE